MLPAIAIPAFAATSGTTGDCTWTLNGTELTISGNGEMEDYEDYSESNNVAPWGTNITKVTIEEGVTSIGEYAFRDCTILTSVTISNSVTIIGEYAFYNCNSLSSVTIGDGITNIGYGAFGFCDFVERVNISNLAAWCNHPYVGFRNYELYLNGNLITDLVIPNGVTTISRDAFAGCISLTSITIPDSVTTIDSTAFERCTGLTSVTIGDEITSIGYGAFGFCGGLTSITIPDSVTNLGGNAFYNCRGLTSVIIGDSIKTLGTYTFEYCTRLTSITLPDSVTAIEFSAFRYCNGLTDVWYTGTEEQRNQMEISVYDNEALENATWHYNTCAKESHIYFSECDPTCENCDWMRTTVIDHTFTDACDTDCNICKATRTPAAHKGGTATCKAKAKCSVCGQSYGSLAAHKYTNACDTDCNICNATRTPAAHKGGTATCKEKAKCSVCGVAYGNLAAHKFGGYVYNNDATSQKDGTKTRTCSVCKKTETVTAAGTKLQNPFKDVKLDQYYAEPVLWAVGKNITNGMSANTFAPNNDCTRGQIVTFLWRAAGSPEPKNTRNPFKDVKSNQYYYKAVLWAVEKGITNGTSANTFSPDATCTRAQVVTFLWRAKGSPKGSATNPFKDVKKSYYSDAVLWAVKNNITTGTSATTFSPDATCTRGQIVTFLYRAYK